MSILPGPEAFWLVVYFVSSWFAGRNGARLPWLYWMAPSAAMAVSFTLCFQWKIPEPLPLWLLVRLTLTAAVGVCVMTNVLVERSRWSDSRGVMQAIVLTPWHAALKYRAGLSRPTTLEAEESWAAARGRCVVASADDSCNSVTSST